MSVTEYKELETADLRDGKVQLVEFITGSRKGAFGAIISVPSFHSNITVWMAKKVKVFKREGDATNYYNRTKVDDYYKGGMLSSIRKKGWKN